MDGSLRYRCLQQGANNRPVRRIQHLRDRLNPLEEYDDANFRLRFRLRKDSVTTLTAILKNDLEHQTRRGNAASAFDFAFLCYSQLSSSNWRFVWSV